jgi:F0F1-type ATP synthase delta subunit
LLFRRQKIKRFLVIQHTPSNKKLDILLSIFPGLTVTMKSFLKVLTERTHLSLIPEISDEYTRILLKFQKCSKVKIITVYKKVLVQHY